MTRVARLSGQFLAFLAGNLSEALESDLAPNGVATLEIDSAEQVLNPRIVRQEPASCLQGLGCGIQLSGLLADDSKLPE